MQRLYLPHELQTVLTPKWNTLLEGYQPSSKKKGRQQLCPGDRVYTSHGPGTILEISGEYCLIDVASRDVKLRERLSNIRM
jgi:hypothetical protein